MSKVRSADLADYLVLAGLLFLGSALYAIFGLPSVVALVGVILVALGVAVAMRRGHGQMKGGGESNE